MNLDQESFTMVYGYLLNCFNPLGPYLVGVVTGQQGSAKTTHCKQIKRLIDPHSAPARQSNIKSNDIAIAARNNYMLLVDNVSGISTEVSDMICQISTGGSFGSRRLYQNDEEHYFSFKRPVILNGIDEIATRGDLADRSAPIRLSAIPEEARKSDLEIEALFMNFGPQIMSSILEGVCSAIRHIPTVSPPYKSRMAGAVQWITASEYGLKLRPGTFSETYERVREEEANYRITEYPVGRAIVALLKRNNNWSGSSSVLLEDLVRYSIDAERYSSLWPKDAAGLGRILRRIEPDLGKAGINIEYHRSASGRKIRLQKKPK